MEGRRREVGEDRGILAALEQQHRTPLLGEAFPQDMKRSRLHPFKVRKRAGHAGPSGTSTTTK